MGLDGFSLIHRILGLIRREYKLLDLSSEVSCLMSRAGIQFLESELLDTKIYCHITGALAAPLVHAISKVCLRASETLLHLKN